MEEFRYEYEHVGRDSEDVAKSVESKRADRELYDEFHVYSVENISAALDSLDEARLEEGLSAELRVKALNGRLKNAYASFIQSSTFEVKKSLIRDLSQDSALLDEMLDKSLVVSDVDDIPPEMIAKILRLRLVSNERREKILNEKLGEMLGEVKKQIIEGIKQGIVKRTEEEVDKIISSFSFKTFDPFFIGHTAYALHNASIRVIELATDVNVEQAPHFILHEIMHSLSGITILGEKNPIDDKVDTITNQRVGLMFFGFDHESGKLNGRKLDWINEAVTEEITMNLSGKSVNVYSVERRKLKKLYELGVDREIIYNAYFEDYNPDDPERVPHWKKFVAELKKIFPDMSVLQALEHVSSLVEEEIKNEKTQS